MGAWGFKLFADEDVEDDRKIDCAILLFIVGVASKLVAGNADREK